MPLVHQTGVVERKEKKNPQMTESKGHKDKDGINQVRMISRKSNETVPEI